MDFVKGAVGHVKERVGDVADVLHPVAHTVVGAAHERLHAAGGTAVDGISAFAEKVERVAPDSLIAAKDGIVSSIKTVVDEKKKWLAEMEERIKARIAQRIEHRLNQLVTFVVGFAVEKGRGVVQQPQAPQFVQRWIDEIVNEVAPEVEEEVKEVIFAAITDEPKIQEIPSNPDMDCCESMISCIWWPIAALRYTLNPCDQTIWWQLRQPLWWIFLLASLIPRYAIGQMVYILWFFVIDKGDEFQLYKYILDFKGLMFLNAGAITGLVGLLQLYLCSVADSCSSYAPMEEYFTLIVFVVQIIFIWIAFGCMACAERKGGFAYQYDAAEAEHRAVALRNPAMRRGVLDAMKHVSISEDSDAEPPEMTSMFGTAVAKLRYANDAEISKKAKGRLTGFLVYDMFLFVVCVVLIALSAFHNVLDPKAEVDFKDGDTLSAKNWKFLLTIYVVRVFYGVFSLPFAALHLPLVPMLVTHSRPTGYNKRGNTVRMEKPKESDS